MQGRPGPATAEHGRPHGCPVERARGVGLHFPRRRPAFQAPQEDIASVLNWAPGRVRTVNAMTADAGVLEAEGFRPVDAPYLRHCLRDLDDNGACGRLPRAGHESGRDRGARRVGLLEPVGVGPGHARCGLGAAVSLPACMPCATPAPFWPRFVLVATTPARCRAASPMAPAQPPTPGNRLAR
jgi:hypothetical protein